MYVTNNPYLRVSEPVNKIYLQLLHFNITSVPSSVKFTEDRGGALH
jgi:hypothetical protein